MVKDGVTWKGVVWTFTHRDDANWHPLTTLSHMVDVQFFGLKPGGHHLMSVLLHALAAILLFLALRQLTGALWPSAFVAAVFTVHPLRVESVAWVAERKDVLSGVFFALTLMAYARYVRQPSARRYLLMAFAFVLGLLSKPMLVTLPFLLLVLDYWPLRRFETAGSDRVATVRRLVVEKLPLIALAILACAITLLTQREVIQKADTTIPGALRASNAIVSYVVYLGQFLRPTNLCAFYPLPPNGIPVSEVVGALLLLAAISVVVFRQRQKRPWLLTGWLWYLGLMVPVIGLVQVGAQAHADRYTYLTQLGITLLLTWTVVDLTSAWPNRRWILGISAGVLLATLIVASHRQTGYWRNSETLWKQTLAATSDDNALAHSNLGNHLFQKGRLDESIEHCRKAIAIWPNDAGAHNCLGFAILQKGQVNEAIEHFQLALASRPNYTPAHVNLGLALFQTGRTDEAIAHFEKALAIDPDMSDAHNDLAAAFVKKGQARDAVPHYERSLALKPDSYETCNNYAWILATWPEAAVRNGPRAVELAKRASQHTGNANLVVLHTLAAAQAEAGQFPEAIATAAQALQLAEAQANQPFIENLRHEIRLYQSGQPLRYPAPAN